MNIFKILSSGDGSIKEPNVSAFLGYLLDPNKEHGLKDYLLKKVLQELTQYHEISSLMINDNIVNLTNDSEFQIDVKLEKKVTLDSGHKRDIDIVIYIYSKSELVFVLCIENKIKGNSVTKNQLIEQMEGISKEVSMNKIGFIYLTPESCPKCQGEYKNFQDTHSGVPSRHLSWNNDIYNALVWILEEESKGTIEPIFEYSKYTIKAFMNFIKTDFQSYKEEKSNINVKDTTKYNFNGEMNLSRAKLALELIRKFVEDNQWSSLDDITSIFGANVALLESLAKEKDESGKKSYYTKEKELIQLSNTLDKVAVNSQIWTKEKIKTLLKIADENSYEIEELS